MRPFNLAESRIVERGYCRTHLNRHLQAIAVFVGITLCIAAASQACRQTIRNRATHVKSELAAVQSKCVAIKRSTAAVDFRLGQRDWQKQLAGGSEKCLGMLDTIIDCVPKDVWLSRIENSQKDVELTLDGQAGSFESMTEFITRLRDSAGFKDVRLTSTKISGTGASPYVDFSLELKLKTNISQAATSAGKVPSVGENH
ncbi:MAG: PilN domain-containing protein [Armatimonadota bacterium]